MLDPVGFRPLNRCNTPAPFRRPQEDSVLASHRVRPSAPPAAFVSADTERSEGCVKPKRWPACSRDITRSKRISGRVRPTTGPRIIGTRCPLSPFVRLPRPKRLDGPGLRLGTILDEMKTLNTPFTPQCTPVVVTGSYQLARHGPYVFS